MSLFGDGSSLAMAGARTLASSLAADGIDAGLRRYEAEHRARTDAKVRAAGRSAALVVPRTRLGLATRNATARLLSRR